MKKKAGRKKNKNARIVTMSFHVSEKEQEMLLRKKPADQKFGSWCRGLVFGALGI